MLFMAVLGAVALHELAIAADLSTRARAATAAVELLRDANSRNFEADRFQHLALHAHDRGETQHMKKAAAAAKHTLGEAKGAYAEWAHTGTTAAERAEGVKQTDLLAKVGSRRNEI